MPNGGPTRPLAGGLDLLSMYGGQAGALAQLVKQPGKCERGGDIRLAPLADNPAEHRSPAESRAGLRSLEFGPPLSPHRRES